jgi:hypothetical protein
MYTPSRASLLCFVIMRDRKRNHTFVLSPFSYFTFYKCSTLHNFTFIHHLLPYRIPVSEKRLVHTSQVRAFSTLLFLSLIVSRRSVLQSHHNVHLGIVKICQLVHNFKCERHVNTVAILKVYILKTFPFQKDKLRAPYTTMLSVFPRFSP